MEPTYINLEVVLPMSVGEDGLAVGGIKLS